MEYFIVFVVGMIIGSYVSTLFNRWIFGMILDRLGIDQKRLRELHSEMANEVAEESPTTASQAKREMPIRLEQHNGVIYAYRKDNNEFVAQGRDKPELLAAMMARFPSSYRLTIDEGTELLEAVAKKQQ